MKKSVSIVLAIMFVLGIVLAGAQYKVQAMPIQVDTQVPDVAGGSWNTGSSLDVTELATSAPNWLQLMAPGGVKITEAGKICHPFRGGQFGWVGEIRQYKDGQWVKLPTINDWVPNKEGEFMSCAQAPAAGIYALFSYNIAPKVVYIEPGPVVTPDPIITPDPDPTITPDPVDPCLSISWSDLSAGADGNVIFNGYVATVPIGTTITFMVTASNIPSLVGETGSYTTTTLDGNFWGDSGISGEGLNTLTVIFTESANDCSSEATEFTFAFSE